MEKSKRFSQFKSDLSASVTDLQESLEYLPNPEDTSKTADLIRNGIVQKFEVVIELLWKTSKLFILEIDGIERSSPRTTFKALYQHNHVNEETYSNLYDLIDWRNKLSHIYHQKILSEAIDYIPGSMDVITQILQIIKNG